jgi:hypothetical protein
MNMFHGVLQTPWIPGWLEKITCKRGQRKARELDERRPSTLNWMGSHNRV